MTTFATMTRRLEARMKAVGKERDKLRELESEVADLAEACDEAIDNLQRAIDALSGLV